MTFRSNPTSTHATGAATPRPRRRLAAALALALIIAAAPARAGTVSLNFETTPFPTTAQPNNFAGAGAEKSYSTPGAFSISGGVVLGNPTFLKEFPVFGSPPNLYGTTDVGDPSLLSTITLNLDASQAITDVSGVLFNGQNLVASGDTETYSVAAYSGGTQVDLKTYNLSINLSSPSSVANFSLSSTAALPITKVTFTTPDAGTNGWDFLVDSIVARGAASVPEPSTLAMGLTGLLFGLGHCRHRRRRAAL